MSDTMSNVMGSAKDGMNAAKEATEQALSSAKSGADSVKKATEHTMSSIVWMALKGASTAAGILTTLRKLDRDDGLAWLGLARRRSPLASVALFGSGVAVGAGLALLLAPMTGADLRAAIVGRTRDLKDKGVHAVEQAEEKVEKVAGDAKEAARRVEHKMEAAVSAELRHASPSNHDGANHSAKA